jgi:hypothetical protein
MIDFKKYEGKKLMFESVSGKYGLTGCRIEDYTDKKTGQTKRKLIITPSVKISEDALVAPKTNGNAPSSPQTALNGKNYEDKKIEGILTSYCKDVLVAMIQAGTDPDEAVSKAVSMIETLYSKVIDFCDGKREQPKAESKTDPTVDLANRLFNDGQE